MDSINENEFYNLLRNEGKVEFRKVNLTTINLTNLTAIELINCLFIGNLHIIDDDTLDNSEGNYKSISIKNCIFKEVNFTKCNFSLFDISDIKCTNDFSFNNCKIQTFRFLDCSNLDFGITFRKIELNDSFNFENNHFLDKGHLSFIHTVFNSYVTIQKNTFSTLRFAFVKFKEFAIITENIFTNRLAENAFISCEFRQVHFSQNDILQLQYIDCKFLGTASFRDIPYNKSSKLSFNTCTFNKHVNFNKSSFYKINFEDGSFLETSSFQGAFFDIILIDRIIFEKQAYFDDIQIKNIDRCNRRTIRTIKLQLQKAENKIDFNRFRVYEFNAYKEDIKQKLISFKKDKNRFYHRKREPIQLRRDLFILNLSEFVSEYGTDWKRALKFTLVFGLIFFTFFFISENYSKPFNISNWEDFAKGYIRFFLITDFYNPLVDDSCYIKSIWSWIPFIFGKIVIAFGIYEMIQSFRKFKA